MRRTEIKYTVTFDDKINVTGISHVLTWTELNSVLGFEKLREYAKKGGYAKADYDSQTIVTVTGCHHILSTGIVTAEQFTKAVNQLKKAGKLFANLKNQVKEVRTLLI